MPNCTLIIPTYNRPQYLRGLLNYYNRQNFDLPIIIADSSTDQNKKINKQIITLLDQLKIEYLDQYSPKLVSHYKFADMVKYVKTPYCAFCADDDFVTPNGIKAGIEFLEQNTDYAAAHGDYIAFYLQNPNAKKQQFWWKKLYPSYVSLAANQPAQRLSLHLANYNQTLWAVRRTKIVQNAYQEMIKCQADPWLFGELLPDLLVAISGNIKRLDVLYMARRLEPQISYWPSWRKFLSSKKHRQKFTVFKNCINDYLIKNSDLKLSQAQEITNRALEHYVKPYYFFNARRHAMTNKIKQCADRLPTPIFKQLALLYVKLKSLKLRYLTMRFPQFLRRQFFNSPDPLPAHYRDDFNQIKKCFPMINLIV